MSSQRKDYTSKVPHVRSGDYCPKEETDRLDYLQNKYQEQQDKQEEAEAKRRRQFEAQKANSPCMSLMTYEEWDG